MVRTLPTVAALTTTLLLGGCAAGTTSPAPGGPDVVAEPTTASASGSAAQRGADSGLPHDELPRVPGGRESWVECPYLDTRWVAETNGQRVTGLGVDERFATPACVFWSYPEEPQLQVIVREMADEQAATRVVDWAAPIDTTEPAEEIPGWSGGRAGAGIGGHEHARYAVAKDNHAVVVLSNQAQSLKAENIARAVIDNLGL